MHKIIDVIVLNDFWIRIKFEDNNIYEFNVKPYLYGEVFDPLNDEKIFRQVKLDTVSGTIVWPTEADFCPDTLYELMMEEKKSGISSIGQNQKVSVK